MTQRPRSPAALGLRHPHVGGRVRRPRGGGRRPLGGILWPAQTREDGRAAPSHRGSQGKMGPEESVTHVPGLKCHPASMPLRISPTTSTLRQSSSSAMPENQVATWTLQRSPLRSSPRTLVSRDRSEPHQAGAAADAGEFLVGADVRHPQEPFLEARPAASRTERRAQGLPLGPSAPLHAIYANMA